MVTKIGINGKGRKAEKAERQKGRKAEKAERQKGGKGRKEITHKLKTHTSHVLTFSRSYILTFLHSYALTFSRLVSVNQFSRPADLRCNSWVAFVEYIAASTDNNIQIVIDSHFSTATT